MRTNRERNFKHNAFLRECPAMLKARVFFIRKTDLDGEEKRLTDLVKKNCLNLNLLNVHSVRKKCCHLRDFVTENSIEIFCMSETWLYNDDSAIITALTPKSHVLHHVPRPDKKGG